MVFFINISIHASIYLFLYFHLENQNEANTNYRIVRKMIFEKPMTSNILGCSIIEILFAREGHFFLSIFLNIKELKYFSAFIPSYYDHIKIPYFYAMFFFISMNTVLKL